MYICDKFRITWLYFYLPSMKMLKMIQSKASPIFVTRSAYFDKEQLFFECWQDSLLPNKSYGIPSFTFWVRYKVRSIRLESPISNVTSFDTIVVNEVQKTCCFQKTVSTQRGQSLVEFAYKIRYSCKFTRCFFFIVCRKYENSEYI